MVDGTIRARSYRPAAQAPSTVLLWLHGGGFSGGSIDMVEADSVARALALAGTEVLSVDYRLVPPFLFLRRWQGRPAVRFPTPVDDCLVGWRWLCSRAEQLDIDRTRRFIGGASAGAALAVLSTLCTPGLDGPRPAGTVLAYPLLHTELPSAGRGMKAALTRWFIRRAAVVLTGSTDPIIYSRVFPRPDQLEGFPPTLVVTSREDGIRASGGIFAADLKNLGIESEIQQVDARHGHLNDLANPAFGETIDIFLEWLHRRSSVRLAGGAD